ncbi:universal stress protein [Sporosarcina thermotolerans]|uniref:Universal stress protein n=1 Tax=Sporosarcina thermotolerans TaxID=633404 RepID=A0AAW9A9J8_9BACL|nr:universal stress protein [Sporosarcina thermotolerans]MDW0117729.1 universal stress protein [Sporosarcina thermotolerans]WHT49181.1 universal stress protein [Sporosarcina thermotolerans]
MKIAVAIDGSENALRAARHAIALAKLYPEATLDVIFVADYNKAKDDRLLSQNEESLLVKRKQKMEPVLDMARDAGVKANMIVLKGNPSQEIINYVNSEAMDQLVLGSRGLNAFQEMVLGSVSHKVMKHVNCPVTVVK